jgi:signal transduction histidine kinase
VKHYLGWQTNLVVFVLITVLVGSYFLRQNQQASRELEMHSRDYSEILAAVVDLTIRNGLLSESALEETVAGSLENSARFIHYLDSIEPFLSVELTAYAAKSGLAGVRIVQGGSTTGVSGPAGWLSDRECGESSGLKRMETEKIYLYSFIPDENVSESPLVGCVLVGLSSREIDAIVDKISVERLLGILEDLHDIAYVRFLSDGQNMDQELLNAQLIHNENIRETAVSIGDRQLIVALKMDRFGKRRIQMQKEFLIFICFLILFGGFSSWWLYWVQRQRLQQVREFERKMARQNEDAALGRAAATITHELRNPLNAIGMGLQRMQIEAEDLDPDHHKLLASMRNAVDRTNTIITRLNQYIHSFAITSQAVNLPSLLRQGVTLYQEQCRKQKIEVEVELDCDQDFSIPGDRVLLEQLFENLLKNSVEAQADGGFIRIVMKRLEKSCCVEIENGGFTLSPEESRLLFEPYFTRKSKGTGLGLVISKKIVLAHKGKLEWQGDFSGKRIKFLITLPLEIS